jgi:hypothetical protein
LGPLKRMRALADQSDLVGVPHGQAGSAADDVDRDGDASHAPRHVLGVHVVRVRSVPRSTPLAAQPPDGDLLAAISSAATEAVPAAAAASEYAHIVRVTVAARSSSASREPLADVTAAAENLGSEYYFLPRDAAAILGVTAACRLDANSDAAQQTLRSILDTSSKQHTVAKDKVTWKPGGTEYKAVVQHASSTAALRPVQWPDPLKLISLSDMTDLITHLATRPSAGEAAVSPETAAVIRAALDECIGDLQSAQLSPGDDVQVLEWAAKKRRTQ